MLVVNNTLPRNMWSIGGVIKTHPSNDNIVRVVDIKTKGGVLRPTDQETSDYSDSKTEFRKMLFIKQNVNTVYFTFVNIGNI